MILREPSGLCCSLALPGRQQAARGSGGASCQFACVQFFFLLLSTQKRAWQPNRNATGMNLTPTRPGRAWASPGRLGLSYS